MPILGIHNYTAHTKEVTRYALTMTAVDASKAELTPVRAARRRSCTPTRSAAASEPTDCKSPDSACHSCSPISPGLGSCATTLLEAVNIPTQRAVVAPGGSRRREIPPASSRARVERWTGSGNHSHLECHPARQGGATPACRERRRPSTRSPGTPASSASVPVPAYNREAHGVARSTKFSAANAPPTGLEHTTGGTALSNAKARGCVSSGLLKAFGRKVPSTAPRGVCEGPSQPSTTSARKNTCYNNPGGINASDPSSNALPMLRAQRDDALMSAEAASYALVSLHSSMRNTRRLARAWSIWSRQSITARFVARQRRAYTLQQRRERVAEARAETKVAAVASVETGTVAADAAGTTASAIPEDLTASVRSSYAVHGGASIAQVEATTCHVVATEATVARAASEESEHMAKERDDALRRAAAAEGRAEAAEAMFEMMRRRAARLEDVIASGRRSVSQSPAKTQQNDGTSHVQPEDLSPRPSTLYVDGSPSSRSTSACHQRSHRPRSAPSKISQPADVHDDRAHHSPLPSNAWSHGTGLWPPDARHGVSRGAFETPVAAEVVEAELTLLEQLACQIADKVRIATRRIVNTFEESPDGYSENKLDGDDGWLSCDSASKQARCSMASEDTTYVSGSFIDSILLASQPSVGNFSTGASDAGDRSLAATTIKPFSTPLTSRSDRGSLHHSPVVPRVSPAPRVPSPLPGHLSPSMEAYSQPATSASIARGRDVPPARSRGPPTARRQKPAKEPACGKLRGGCPDPKRQPAPAFLL